MNTKVGILYIEWTFWLCSEWKEIDYREWENSLYFNAIIYFHFWDMYIVKGADPDYFVLHGPLFVSSQHPDPDILTYTYSLRIA
jgi:hypothetical protein